MEAVRAEHLAKTYRSVFGRSVEALREFSLTVAQGEIFGLLGPNGAGKTTLVKILLSVVRPSAGTAFLFDVPVARPAARTRIGFLPENHRFPGFLTSAQMLDLYGRMAGVEDADRARRIDELLERVGLKDWRDTRIKQFSKGMMQRAGLAQALMNRPDLLFLDEPTDGVDPIGRRQIRDLLVWLRDEGTTIFLNSHLLSEVEQVCTRVAILNEGRMVHQGRLDELTSEKAYEVVATPLPSSTQAALEALVRPAEAAAPGELARYRILAPDRRQLNAVLDRLRADGVELESVRPLRRSLEDFFIDVIQTGDKASRP